MIETRIVLVSPSSPPKFFEIDQAVFLHRHAIGHAKAVAACRRLQGSSTALCSVTTVTM